MSHVRQRAKTLKTFEAHNVTGACCEHISSLKRQKVKRGAETPPLFYLLTSNRGKNKNKNLVRRSDRHITPEKVSQCSFDWQLQDQPAMVGYWLAKQIARILSDLNFVLVCIFSPREKDSKRLVNTKLYRNKDGLKAYISLDIIVLRVRLFWNLKPLKDVVGSRMSSSRVCLLLFTW